MPRDFFAIVSPLLIGFLPIFLHLIDKALERISPFSEEYLQKRLEEAKSPAIKRIGQLSSVFKRVQTYFDFERKFHFIITLIIFNIFSLYFAQTECTQDWLHGTLPTFLGIVILILFLLAFIWRTLHGAFSPAAVNPTKYWEIVAIGAFLGVVMLELDLHQDLLPDLRPVCSTDQHVGMPGHQQ